MIKITLDDRIWRFKKKNIAVQLSNIWKIFSVAGYNILGSTNTERYSGFWSDESPTKVEVGVWGDFEPNTPIGSCARVDKSHDNKWYMESCDRLLPSVCELTPCPDGMYGKIKNKKYHSVTTVQNPI